MNNEQELAIKYTAELINVYMDDMLPNPGFSLLSFKDIEELSIKAVEKAVADTLKVFPEFQDKKNILEAKSIDYATILTLQRMIKAISDIDMAHNATDSIPGFEPGN